MFCALNGATRTPCAAPASGRCRRSRTLLPASEVVPQTSSAPLIARTRYWRRSACRRRAYSRRILTRLPHVDIEHHRRRPLVSRKSQPHAGPGQRCTRARRAGSASSADGVDRDGEADGARLGRGPGQAPGAVVRGREPRGARRLGVVAGERLEVGPPRPATLRQRREDAVQDEAQRACRLELVVVDDRRPPADQAQPPAPAGEVAGDEQRVRASAPAARPRATSRRCWRSPGTGRRPRA